jgi:hypothetical protein
MFIIIEPVAMGRLLIEVLPAGFYRLRHTDMLTGHDRVNTYDFRCRSFMESPSS